MIYFGMVISILDIGIQGQPTVGQNHFVPWATLCSLGKTLSFQMKAEKHRKRVNESSNSAEWQGVSCRDETLSS